MTNEIVCVCRVCGIQLTNANWYPSLKSNYNKLCKACDKKKNKEWKLRNKDLFRAQQTNYSRHETLNFPVNGKNFRTVGLTKRPHPGECELCGEIGRLAYHHWNDNNLSMGIWLCFVCHRGAEFSDQKGVDTILKYQTLKRYIEENEKVRIQTIKTAQMDSQRLKTEQQKTNRDITINRYFENHKEKMLAYRKQYAKKYIHIFYSSVPLGVKDSFCQCFENIAVNVKTNIVSVQTGFRGTNGVRLPIFTER